MPVYPRVGGGTRSVSRLNAPDCRSIPAWVGEPSLPGWADTATWVYPRVGGGTATNNAESAIDRGLSPRGRGNLTFRTPGITGIGSIPAWAGEPLRGWDSY